jgi:flagellar motor switch protein FliM
VVVVSFQVKMFQATGLLTICYPYVALEPVITKLSAQNWIDATKKKSEGRDRSVNERNVKLVMAEVSAELSREAIRMRDFLSLRKGDVIPSMRRINEPMVVSVNEKRKYLAQPGLSGKHRAVQIIQECDQRAKES